MGLVWATSPEFPTPPDGTKQQLGKAGVKVVSALKDIDMVALKDGPAEEWLRKTRFGTSSSKYCSLEKEMEAYDTLFKPTG